MASKPRRIQRKRTKGWRMPKGAVYVGRPTKYGNPFRIGDPGVPDAATAARKYLIFLAGGTEHAKLRERVGDVGQLRGKVLACWCKPGEPCHADVLLDIANQQPKARKP